MVAGDEQLQIYPLKILKRVPIGVDEVIFGLRIPVYLYHLVTFAFEIAEPPPVIGGQKLNERIALGLGIPGGSLELLGIDYLLEALVKRQRRNNCRFRRHSEKPETRVSKTQNEKTCCGQRIDRQPPKRRNLHAYQEGRFQITPHNGLILP